MWLWDSVFNSIGFKYIDKSLAKDTLIAVLKTQKDDGMIPHMSSPRGYSSDITQPPVLAWGIYDLYRHTKDISVLTETYEKLKKYLVWMMENRDTNKNFLYEWNIDSTSTLERCNECGADNSPRFDNVTAMDSIDFSCYMANDTRCMSKIAEVLNMPDEASYWDGIFQKIKDAVNDNLYDEEDGLYYDKILDTGEFRKVKTYASFLPMFAEICDKERAKSLYSHLCNAKEFASKMPVPTVSMDDVNFSSDMWRGSSWIVSNYMIIRGLKNYGYIEKSKEFVNATLSAVLKWYLNDGVIYEYYDPKNEISPSRLERKGPNITPYMPMLRKQTVKDYGWSAALSAAMIIEDV